MSNDVPMSNETHNEAEALRQRVVFLLDEVKRLFRPEMKITFIARNPSDPDMQSILTEESVPELIAFLQQADALREIRVAEPSPTKQ